MLRADLDAFGLQDLTDVKKRGEVLRHRILAEHVFADQLIAARVLLMRQHDRRLYVLICGQRVGVDGLKLREGLKAVFAHEARPLFLIVREGQRRMPDTPVMHIAHRLRVGISF